MTNERRERIRERAHEIWEREGRPEGRDVEHWQMAVAEIEAEAAQEADVGAPAAPAAKPRKAKAAPATEAEPTVAPESAMNRVAAPDNPEPEAALREAKTRKRAKKQG